MSDMLSIGATGLRAYQTALTTVSENIANASTPGYTRRTTAIREVGAQMAQVGALNGMGANIAGIGRSSDVFRADDVRTAGSDLARTEAGVEWLQSIQTNLTSAQLGTRLTAFFNASTAVAADPTALAQRSTMLEAAASLASAFTTTGRALAGAMNELDSTADTAVNQLNTLGAALGKINAGLSKVTPGTSGQAALMDERDRLLEQMSAITDLDVTFDPAGRANVRAGGASGPVLVNGDSAAMVTYVRNDEGAVSYAVHRNGSASALTPSGGVLAGVIDGAQRLAEALQQVSDLAQAFVEGVNEVQAAGDDLAGDPGGAMFTAGDPPYEMTLALTDPRGIAAAAPDGGPRDNGNLAGFEALRSSGNFERGLTDMTTGNATALAARKSVAEAQTAIRDHAVNRRDEVSGVSIDEEAVDLIRFQQAFQASSRVIQVAREALQSLFDVR